MKMIIRESRGDAKEHYSIPGINDMIDFIVYVGSRGMNAGRPLLEVIP